jgi:activating signal cointegrator complex subunit 2
MLALARAYDEGLAGIAGSYGGVRGYLFEGEWAEEGEVDEWERVWVETKVGLMDSFHLLLGGLVGGLVGEEVGVGSEGLGREVERSFDIIFAILDLPSTTTPTPTSSTTPTPFLNRPLLADYQHTYDLSRTLSSTLSRHQREREKDARLELLESTLRSFDDVSGTRREKGAGALKILLRSSGIQPGIDNRGNSKDKGKARAPPPPHEDDHEITEKISQVLSILPDTNPANIRALLARNPGWGVEKIVGAILEGEDGDDLGEDGGKEREEKDYVYTKERRNVFDDLDAIIDLGSVRVGKKRFAFSLPSLLIHTNPYANSQDPTTILQDRTYIEQMKADILRRVEAFSDSESDSEPEAQSQAKGRTVAFEEELDDGGGGDVGGGESVKVIGDGEDSGPSDDSEDSGEEREEGKQNPETVLELTYIRDPKLFDRDAATRRGKGRVELRSVTGSLSFFLSLLSSVSFRLISVISSSFEIDLNLTSCYRLVRRADRGVEDHVGAECEPLSPPCCLGFN